MPSTWLNLLSMLWIFYLIFLIIFTTLHVDSTTSLVFYFPIQNSFLSKLQYVISIANVEAEPPSLDGSRCIAGEDLSEFGAAKEGWLAPDASTTLLCALDAHSLAIANRSLILIIGWSDPDEFRAKIRPDLSPIEAEHITAVEWLVFYEIKAIAVGTFRGFIMVYTLRADLIHRQSSQRYYCAVTIGDDAVISAFRLSEDRTRSLIGAILSKVVPATFSRIASFSKMIWRSEQMPKRKSEEKPQSFARASPLTCLKDHPRKGEKLTLSPSGTLAAITDSLGRILLLDTQTLVVVRLWKGYCDASCFFMEMLVNKEAIGSGCSYYEPGKSDYCLCLAIHAR